MFSYADLVDYDDSGKMEKQMAERIKQLEAIAAHMHTALCNVESYCLEPGSPTFTITNKTMTTVCDATRAYREMKGSDEPTNR